MGIPQLSSCCCGCSLKTGTTIIGWLSLIAAFLMLVMSCFGLIGLYYIEDHPDSTAESQYILVRLPVLKTLAVFLIVVYILACCLSIMLLVGTYQNKAKLIFFWVEAALTSALLYEALNLIQVIALAQPAKLISTPFFLIDLYLILVVYSFYREIKNKSADEGKSAVELVV